MADLTSHKTEPSEKTTPSESSRSIETASLKMLSEVHDTLTDLTTRRIPSNESQAVLDFSLHDIFSPTIHSTKDTQPNSPGGGKAGSDGLKGPKGYAFTASSIESSGEFDAEGIKVAGPAAIAQADGVSLKEAKRIEADEIAIDDKLKGAAGVEQSGYGDCSFEAAVDSLASTKEGAKEIAGMIKYGALTKKNGQYIQDYEVKLPGYDKTITVTNLQAFTNPKINPSQAAWASILEAAGEKIDPKGFKNGMWPSQTLGWLTGKHETASSITGTSKEKLGAEIEYALRHDDPIVADTAGKNEPSGMNVYGGHAYTVLGYDAKDKTITLRNPWGMNETNNHFQVGETNKWGVTNEGDGVVKMSLADFYKTFTEVTTSLPGRFTESATQNATDTPQS